jgi:hemerythrin
MAMVSSQKMAAEIAMNRLKGAHITWSESYSMRIKEIDDQHKGLINFVNDLFSHVSGNEKEEHAYFKGVIQQAVDYIKTHFATEEKYMLKTKFPGYAEHKKTHEEFILTVVQTAKDYESGKRLTLEKLAYFLKDWILSHIAIMDKKYSEYFWKIATRKEDGKLSINIEDVTRAAGGG